VPILGREPHLLWQDPLLVQLRIPKVEAFGATPRVDFVLLGYLEVLLFPVILLDEVLLIIIDLECQQISGPHPTQVSHIEHLVDDERRHVLLIDQLVLQHAEDAEYQLNVAIFEGDMKRRLPRRRLLLAHVIFASLYDLLGRQLGANIRAAFLNVLLTGCQVQGRGRLVDQLLNDLVEREVASSSNRLGFSLPCILRHCGSNKKD